MSLARVQGELPKAQGIVDFNPCLDFAKGGCRLHHILLCFWSWVGGSWCKGKVITHAFRHLKAHDKNYPSLESVVVVFVLKLWLLYLNGVHCEIFTDHRSLQYIFSQRDLNLRQRRWIALKDYDLTILYHPWKANVVAGALNRKAFGMASLAALRIKERSFAKA